MPRLLPLPRCEGPKLEPFTQDFESIKLEAEHLIKDRSDDGAYAHGMVLKAKLDGKLYAIKFFVRRWFAPYAMKRQYPGLSNEEYALAVIQTDPFYAECRAFGRLKETGMEHLAVKVHGYIQVDTNERTTEMLRSAFALQEWGAASDLADFFVDANIDPDTQEQIPVMGIVKDWVEGEEKVKGCDDEESYLRVGLNQNNLFIRHASAHLNNLHQLHRHGIVVRDIHRQQYINRTLVDLSCAWTTPHVLAQGDRFRPDWSLASMAACDLYDFQQTLDTVNSRRDYLLSHLRRLGINAPKIRPSKVVAYLRTGDRPALRPRSPRGPGGGKRLLLLSDRMYTAYAPDDPVFDFSEHSCDAILWAYGPKYDPALFQWRKIGNGEVSRGGEDEEDVDESERDKVGRAGKTGKAGKVGKAGKTVKAGKVDKAGRIGKAGKVGKANKETKRKQR